MFFYSSSYSIFEQLGLLNYHSQQCECVFHAFFTVTASMCKLIMANTGFYGGGYFYGETVIHFLPVYGNGCS